MVPEHHSRAARYGGTDRKSFAAADDGHGHPCPCSRYTSYAQAESRAVVTTVVRSRWTGLLLCVYVSVNRDPRAGTGALHAHRPPTSSRGSLATMASRVLVGPARSNLRSNRRPTVQPPYLTLRAINITQVRIAQKAPGRMHLQNAKRQRPDSNRRSRRKLM